MFKNHSYDLRLREGKVEAIERKTDPNKKKKSSNFYRSIGIVSELGFVIAFPLVGGILLGTKLDQKFSSYPKLTLSLLLLGVTVSFCNLLLVMRDFLRKDK